PRPLAVDWPQASEQVRALARTWKPFDVELTRIGIFPVTNVIYIEIGEGAAELRQMHAATNQEALAFEEPFVYHPHVTLAQEIPQDQVEAVRERAVRRWNDLPGERRFRAQHAVLVQNT